MSRTDRRFNSEEYLTNWRAKGQFPKIHDALFNMIAAEALGTSGLDLCCSTGMLGTRLIEKLGWRCVGVDADKDAIALSESFGLPMPIRNMVIDDQTLPELVGLLERNRVEVLVARRCLCDVFCPSRSGDPGGFGFRFVDALAGAGIRECFVQGMANVGRSTHPIPNIDAEVAFFTGRYRVVRKVGEVAYLRKLK